MNRLYEQWLPIQTGERTNLDNVQQLVEAMRQLAQRAIAIAERALFPTDGALAPEGRHPGF
jgi:hypothetical protein